MPPCARIVEHPFAKGVAAALRARCGVREGARLLLAVSGGADSVAMLRAIAPLAQRRAWRLTLCVGHVQHHLRADAEAEGDAAFTAALAAELNLPYCRADLPLPPAKENAEAWARRERYRALAESARALDAGFIVTAHHADDQLETVLMRLLRGASITGLRGIAWRRAAAGDPAKPAVAVIRPLLAVDRAAVLSFLDDIEQPWREDHTNLDLSRLRARLRHEVLPRLREAGPHAAGRAVRLGDHLRGVCRVVDEAVAEALSRVRKSEGKSIVPRPEARLLPRVVLTGVLRRVLLDAGTGADHLGAAALRSATRAVRDHTGGRRVFTFANGVTVAVTRDEVTIGHGGNGDRTKRGR
jgi:tRNA(Ile)-lysidine synthase